MRWLLGPALAALTAASGPAPAGAEAAEPAEPAQPVTEAAPEPTPKLDLRVETVPTSERPKASPDDEDQGAAPGPELLDVVLPSGVRVIAATDESLPVAAVVLALEVGTRDDPKAFPGLVHALAYHLQQGNRELGPGEAIATAHDAGGLAGMAVGTAQVRFESLVPVSQLDPLLRAESLRLRAPNISRELWLKSLSYARNDAPQRPLVPLEATAAAWSDASIAHDGRQVSTALSEMPEQAVSAQLSRLFDYRSATLVIVGPETPEDLLARAEPLFASLPARPRRVPAAASVPESADGPRTLAIPKQKGNTMVWAVEGSPRARAWAQVLCGTLNRQRRAAEEPRNARVRCTYADDARRPLLIVRADGFEAQLGPEPLVAGRLQRIADLAQPSTQAPGEPELAALLEAQRARMNRDIRFNLRTPLELAIYLAAAEPGPAQAGTRRLPVDEVLGLPMLATPPADAALPVADPAPADADADAGDDAPP
ncbi:insulinase family protein, partial [Plesiocystis pacifica]|uniref:insulinase family protein n=1 Tax=Plesiocystis pacifica TaxID=191768 RepID=UPI0018DD04CA